MQWSPAAEWSWPTPGTAAPLGLCFLCTEMWRVKPWEHFSGQGFQQIIQHPSAKIWDKELPVSRNTHPWSATVGAATFDAWCSLGQSHGRLCTWHHFFYPVAVLGTKILPQNQCIRNMLLKNTENAGFYLGERYLREKHLDSSNFIYHPVNWHFYGKSPCLMGSYQLFLWPCSMANC